MLDLTPHRYLEARRLAERRLRIAAGVCIVLVLVLGCTVGLIASHIFR